MTPDEAIKTLRSLPPDRQKSILGQMSPDVKKGVLAQLQGQAKPLVQSPQPQAQDKPYSLMDTVKENLGMEKDFITGVGKGALGTANTLSTPMRMVVDKLVGKYASPEHQKEYNEMSGKVQSASDATNNMQTAGKVAEGVGEMLIPGDFIPRAGRAGKAIGEIEKLAAQRGIYTALPKATKGIEDALDLGRYSANVPKVINALGKDVEGMKSGMRLPLSFGEARNAYKNLSEAARKPHLLQKLLNPESVTSPALRGQVKKTAGMMNSDLTEALRPIGKSEAYTQAINEYRRAMALRQFLGRAVKYGALAGLPWHYRHAGYLMLGGE